MECDRSIELFITENSIIEESKLEISLLERCSNFLLKKTKKAEGLLKAGIYICDEQEMKSLHSQFMNDDSETDVMAFESEEEDYLGDIIVCSEVAKKCSLEHQNTFLAELHFYCLHGLLHLLGYDDNTEEEKNEMLKLQQEALLSEGVQVNIE